MTQASDLPGQGDVEFGGNVGQPRQQIPAGAGGTNQTGGGSSRSSHYRCGVHLKWDMNRPISDVGRPGDPHGRQWTVQHTEGYYTVLRMLREEFPQVTVEACSGGGGRIDAAVLS